MPLRILRFNETASGATYTARTNIPKGARLIDIFAETTVGWTAATANLDLGDSDGADSLITSMDMTSPVSVNVKGSGASGSKWASPPDPYSDQGAGILYPAGDTITAVITAGTPGGPTGLSSVVLWFEPQGAGQLANVV
jgi:hypothetical protein